MLCSHRARVAKGMPKMKYRKKSIEIDRCIGIGLSIAFISCMCIVIILEVSKSETIIHNSKKVLQNICHQQHPECKFSEKRPVFQLLCSLSVYQLLCLRCWGIYLNLFLVFTFLEFMGMRCRPFTCMLIFVCSTALLAIEKIALPNSFSAIRLITGAALGIGLGTLLNAGLVVFIRKEDAVYD